MSFYATFFTPCPPQGWRLPSTTPNHADTASEEYPGVATCCPLYCTCTFVSNPANSPEAASDLPPSSRGTFFRSSLSNCNFSTAVARKWFAGLHLPATSNVDKLCRIVRGSSCEVCFAARRRGSDVKIYVMKTLFLKCSLAIQTVLNESSR